MIRRALLAASLLASPALAAQAPPPLPPNFEFTSDFSFVNTGGNARVTTTGFSDKMIFRHGWRWTHTQTFGVIYGKSQGEVNAESYRAGVRSDMAFTARLASYAQVAFFRNVFAGKAAEYETSLGLSGLVYDSPKSQFRFESGLTRTHQRATTDAVRKFLGARVAGLYRHSFGTATYFEQQVELLPNLDDGDDLRLNSASAIVAPISSHIGLKAKYEVRWDHQPQAGFKETDTIFTTGLQLTF